MRLPRPCPTLPLQSSLPRAAHRQHRQHPLVSRRHPLPRLPTPAALPPRHLHLHLPDMDPLPILDPRFSTLNSLRHFPPLPSTPRHLQSLLPLPRQRQRRRLRRHPAPRLHHPPPSLPSGFLPFLPRPPLHPRPTHPVLQHLRPRHLHLPLALPPRPLRLLLRLFPHRRSLLLLGNQHRHWLLPSLPHCLPDPYSHPHSQSLRHPRLHRHCHHPCPHRQHLSPVPQHGNTQRRRHQRHLARCQPPRDGRILHERALDLRPLRRSCLSCEKHLEGERLLGPSRHPLPRRHLLLPVHGEEQLRSCQAQRSHRGGEIETRKEN